MRATTVLLPSALALAFLSPLPALAQTAAQPAGSRAEVTQADEDREDDGADFPWGLLGLLGLAGLIPVKRKGDIRVDARSNR